MAAKWGAGAYAILTPEVTYAAFNGAGTPLLPRLVSDTAFLPQSDPQRKAIMSAEGGNRRIQNVSSRVVVTAKLHTAVYPTQAQALLDWCLNISTGDLPSYTADFFDTQDKARYVGGKVKQLTLTCSAEQDEGVMYADLDLVFQQVLGTAPTISPPAYTSYPPENPYVHIESATAFTLHGARASYNQWKLTVTNNLAATFDELATITNLVYCGRTVDMSTNFQYGSTSDRTDYEAQTALASQIVFTKVTPAHTMTVNLNGQGRIAKRNRALPLGSIARQGIDFECFYDPSATTDVTYSTT